MIQLYVIHDKNKLYRYRARRKIVYLSRTAKLVSTSKKKIHTYIFAYVAFNKQVVIMQT